MGLDRSPSRASSVTGRRVRRRTWVVSGTNFMQKGPWIGRWCCVIVWSRVMELGCSSVAEVGTSWTSHVCWDLTRLFLAVRVQLLRKLCADTSAPVGPDSRCAAAVEQFTYIIHWSFCHMRVVNLQPILPHIKRKHNTTLSTPLHLLLRLRVSPSKSFYGWLVLCDSTLRP